MRFKTQRLKNTGRKKKTVLWIIFLISLLDLLGFGLLLPVLQPLLFDEIGLAASNPKLLFGYLVGFYAIAQFLGAPITGSYADKVGRKKVLLLLFIVNGIGALSVAFALISKSVIPLFLGRLIPAFFGSTLMILQTMIADISNEEDKTRNFGIFGAALGIGFIFGPIIGGITGSINSAIPFALAGMLTFVNGVLMWFLLPETIKKRSTKEINIFSGIKNLKFAFSSPKLRGIYSVVFLLSMGFALFTQFFPDYLNSELGYSKKQIGYMLAWIGIWVAITQGGLLRPVSKRFSPTQMMIWAIPIFAFTYLLILIPNSTSSLMLCIILFSVFQGFTFPNTLAYISNTADETMQGESLSINQSVQSFAYGLPAILGGFVIEYYQSFPSWFGFVITLIAFIVFYKTIYQKEKP